MKKLILLCSFAFLLNILFAQNKTWNGAAGANWNVAGNWLPTGVPNIADTVIFNSVNGCNVDVNPSVASIRATGAGGNLFSSGGARIITINNNGDASPVLNVALGSFLSLGGPSGIYGVSITTYGGASPNNAQIDGNLFFGNASFWALCNGGFTNITNVDVSGGVSFVAIHTGPATVNSSIATLRFLSGSTLGWSRTGGALPVADYQNGSTINITGTTSSMVSLNTTSNYNGLLIWNSNLGQTISGAAAVLLPTTSFALDSLRVISTGTGTLRLATEPTGYTINHIEVQGGTLELSSPATGNRFATISTGLKISGGSVIGNATYIGDVDGYAMTLTVNGDVSITGGTLNLTNRASVIGGGDGALQLNARGHVIQSGGAITATTAFGSQNYISMNGTSSQNLEMDNITGPAGLVINNSAGVVLQDNVTLPYALVLINGLLATSSSSLLTMAAGSVVAGASNASFVNGPVKKIGNTAFAFPVGKPNCGPTGTVNGYAALEISAFTGGAVTDQYTAEYKRGDALALGLSGMPPGVNHISRCDYWSFSKNVGASTVNITLYWDEAINNCISSTPYVNNRPSLTVAHFNGANWDTYGIAGNTSGTNASGSVTWGAPQSSTFGFFAIGSVDFLNPLPITVNYFTGIKQGNNHLLNWKIDCSNNQAITMSLERSTDGIHYSGIYSAGLTALQCQQAFSYIDNQPLAGVNYYRLKMADVNGKMSYSTTVSLINGSKGFDVMNIAPNPIVNGRFKLNVSTAQKMQLDIIVTDMQGRLMLKKTTVMIAGFNAVDMNVNGLAAGTYQVYAVSAEGRSRMLRFVMQ